MVNTKRGSFSWTASGFDLKRLLECVVSQKSILDKVCEQAEADPNVEVLWLYGSRAKGTETASSDYDLAIAFCGGDAAGAPFYTDELAYRWSQLTGATISIVDINNIPVPLAYNVVNEGVVLISKNALRLHSEQARIWSLWEEYRYEYIKNRA